MLGLAASAPAGAAADGWWGADKASHLGISFALGASAYGGLALAGKDVRVVRLLLSVGLALAPGLAKEIYDSGQPGNSFSARDLTWDLVGAVTGSLVALTVELVIRRWVARRMRAGPRANDSARGASLFWRSIVPSGSALPATQHEQPGQER
jgi:putative lipoprotein